MSKVMKTMWTSILIIVSLGVAVLIVVLNTTNEEEISGSSSLDDLVRYSYETPEVTTDLEDGSFVRIQFQILTDGKEAREEIAKRDFQLRNILIKQLASFNEDHFKSGLTELEDTIKTELNSVMTEGDIIDVYTINKILQ